MLNRIAFGWGLQRDGGLQGPSDKVVRYLLRDLFSTDIAAGSVNATVVPLGTGTVAQRTRTVVDTNSKLSITGGQLSAATGGSGSGDPILWYGQITRGAGRFVLGYLTSNSVTGRPAIGFDNAQTGAVNDAITFQDTSTLNATVSGANVAVGVIAQATVYSICIVARATGFWHFIKGGAFTAWNLVWVSAAGTSNLFPACGQNASGTTTIFVADDIRVPESVLSPLPTPICYDTFTRSDGALGNSETTGPDSQSVTARAWTGATYTISTNKAINTPTLGSDVVVNGAFAADTDWNKGAGWTIAGGVGVATAASSDITAASAPLTTGTWYQTVITCAANAGGTGNIKLGTTAFPTHSTNATFTETGRATSTALAVTATGWTATIDNFSAKAITLSELFASVVSTTADAIADVAVTLESATSGKQAGLVANLDSTSSPANFIIIYLDGNGSCKADECVAGTYTNKISAAVTYSAGAVLRVVRSGTQMRVYYNGAAVGSLATMTANTNVRYGLFSTSPLSSLDAFTVWPRGTSNEWTALDAY